MLSAVAYLCTNGAVDEDDLDARRAQRGLDILVFVRRRVFDERLADRLVECGSKTNELASEMRR